MDCSKTQRLMNDLADGRLNESAAQSVQRHVAECSDCRVVQQRGLRLQQLLSVKRHECPGAEYFDSFLNDFHHRLALDPAPRLSIWQRFFNWIHVEPVFTIRYGFAHAL